uniref:Moesin/ezrin/radixin homolog 1 n=1 Tax=Timema cristinae TaxID=61476 RepID=A0A7R9CY31_TIMCR|nr:unnamed protein product [Timema cristinae]
MFPFGCSKKVGKLFTVKVCSLEAELEFNLKWNTTGKELLALVCQTIGIRDSGYFGLFHDDSNKGNAWLQPNKKILQQIHPKQTHCFMLLLKFYPEDVSDLSQDASLHLLFLQVRQLILRGDIYCPAEVCVLLASYDVQAKHGDYVSSTHKCGMIACKDLLPSSVFHLFNMTPDMWEDRIKHWYSQHKGLSRREAELEYLKLAQELKMYGVTLYSGSNKDGAQIWLGATPTGLNIYCTENAVDPHLSFRWPEIKNFGFKNEKFAVELVKKCSQNVVFVAQHVRMNGVIFDMCSGYHKLFLRRREPNSREGERVKSHTREEKCKRQVEQEKQLRESAEKGKAIAEAKLLRREEEIKLFNAGLHRYREAFELLSEKSRVVEEQAWLLTESATSYEQRVNRFSSTQPTDQLLSTMENIAAVDQGGISSGKFEFERNQYLPPYREGPPTKLGPTAEQSCVRIVPSHAMMCQAPKYCPTDLEVPLNPPQSASDQLCPGVPSMVPSSDTFMNQLLAEIEKEKTEYLHKSRHLFQLCKDLSLKIDELKN